ncbi:hypothetical protein NQ317_004465 [Molorchus minor]|uniref:TMC domain-containing protein n=1 Tax=Molorchus minor TaxID=1323400 RepID=A0ABQ9JLM0_9CUCU|nr:hypothetical protein NQ317_004465 [Molorchus minor]
MTNEQHNFRNIVCAESRDLVHTSDHDSNIINYANDNKNTENIVSANLVSELAYNISNAVYPNVMQLIKGLIMNATSELTASNNSLYDYYASFENFTDYLEHLPELNYIENEFSNVSYYVNQTLEYINFTNFKDVFVDYLTYILYPFKGNETEIAVLNISNINSSEITDSSSFVGDSFSVFRLAMISLFGNISNYFNDTMEKEILNIYNNISTTVTSILENKTLYSTDSTNVSTKIVTAQITTESSYSPTTLVIPVKGNYTMCARLRALCWETMFGQELIKLTVMDLIMTILSTLAIDFFRGIFVRVMNRCWCWDLEKKFPQYGDFKVAENILHLVNNQGMVWMGMFFSPGLVVLNIIKLHIMMYFRAWAVLTCNVPPEVIFRASRSNNFYYALLLMMLFLCVLPVGYTIVWIKPSFHCGPFSRYQKIFHIFTETVRNTVPETFQKALDYIASPGIVIPLLVLLTLIIYYLISLTGALREANEDLKIQLHRERTEERRKMFQIVDRRRGGSGESNELSNTPYAKWNKFLVALPNAKSFDDTAKQVSEEIPQSKTNGKVENKSKDFFTKFIKKALGKSSTSDEEQNMEDATDTEQHESLPYDPTLTNQHRTVKSSLSWGNSNISHATASTEFSRNGGRVDSFPSESTDSFEIKPNDNRSTTSKYSTIGHYTFDFNKGQQQHKTSGDPMPSTSKYVRQDSGSSVWSDNIPVITISKVSTENKLEDNTETHLGKNKLNIKLSEQRKLKANVECPLKKQSSTIDEDIMCHANIERATNIPEKKIIKAVAEEDSGNGTVSGNSRFEDLSDMSDISNKNLEILEDISTDKSSSEDTAYKDSSIDTIFQSPHVNKDT